MRQAWRLCQDYGVIPQSFLTNNESTFNSRGNQEHLAPSAK
jgi:hypothetical protein